eukprot:TRINITY_DN5643_c0_g1_i1.p1 TRINITY_DN5643_c0_g1~~TRINITY_DN5643_c0_g1_i1.p1  ORF type:complete len:133 (-),score=18.23 TRINITY_DN5643_c0_g1_i1:120-518(-)
MCIRDRSKHPLGLARSRLVCFPHPSDVRWSFFRDSVSHGSFRRSMVQRFFPVILAVCVCALSAFRSHRQFMLVQRAESPSFLPVAPHVSHLSFSSKTSEDTDTTRDVLYKSCLLYTSPSPRDRTRSRMPSSA